MEAQESEEPCIDGISKLSAEEVYGDARNIYVLIDGGANVQFLGREVYGNCARRAGLVHGLGGCTVTLCEIKVGCRQKGQ